ncbi:NADPH dehydrogenase [Fusarium coicis]|nr:NADPH dehydrogenase [Fusarium coicis]
MSYQKIIPLYPHVAPAPGTPIVENEVNSTLFSPLQVRGLTLQNRIAVSPMGLFSANDGHLTDFHLVHYGSFATRGAALVIVEATAVTLNARNSTGDSGLWKDSQIAPLKRVVDCIHTQGQKAGIQLYHSGPKGSMLPPWFAKGDPMVQNEEAGGWPDDVWAPSAICHGSGYPMPKEMGHKQIDLTVEQFASAARRAAEAGVEDFIEIHGAHGYLISTFLSPLTNHRTDEYGGSFENRTRFLFRVLKAVRDAIPDTVVLSLRISAVEWMEWNGQDCWTLEESIKLAKLLPQAGVDLLDVSSGGNHIDQKIDVHPYYQVDLAYQIRQALKNDGIELLIAAVGLIDNPAMAESVVRGNSIEAVQKMNGTNGTNADADRGKYEEPQADLVMVGRQFLRDAGFVLTAAKSLGVKVQWPLQYSKGK